MRKATKEGKLIQSKRTLTEQEEKFCRLRVAGASFADAYIQAGYNAKDRTIARVCGWEVAQRPRVKEFLDHLHDIQYKAEALSKEEKRLFLAGLVRTKPSDLTPDSPYASATVSDDGEIRLSGPRISDKVAAIKEDGEIIGDKASNGLQTQSNPMIFIRLSESEKLAQAQVIETSEQEQISEQTEQSFSTD